MSFKLIDCPSVVIYDRNRVDIEWSIIICPTWLSYEIVFFIIGGEENKLECLSLPSFFSFILVVSPGACNINI